MKTEHNIVAVDTSSRVLAVAVIRDAETAFEASLDGTPRHSERLLGLIKEGLSALHLEREEIKQLVWGLGPGSFTGLRIGLSVLKGLSAGLKKKAFGVSSLDLIALGAEIISGELLVCVDARRDRIYGAVYRFDEGRAVKVVQDSLFSFDELKEQLKSRLFVTGDGLLKYGEQIRDIYGTKISFLDSRLWYPRANALVRLCREYPERLEALTLKSIQPRYFRISEAEEKLKLRLRKN